MHRKTFVLHIKKRTISTPWKDVNSFEKRHQIQVPSYLLKQFRDAYKGRRGNCMDFLSQ